MRKPSRTAEQLRKAIRESDLGITVIAREVGIPAPQLCEFAAGRRDLSMGNADIVMDFFGLEVRPKR